MEKSQKVKLIPFEKIIQLMDTSCKTYEVKRSESQIYDALVTAFPAAMIQDKKYVAYDDVVLFMDNWIKALKTKDFNFLTQKRGMRCEPVDIEEFIESKDYLNQATQIRPAIKREMLKLYEPGTYYPEVIMTGATGIGKDYMAYLIIARTLYELWCYYNPQVEFGLASGTSMVIAIQSITRELAKKVTFDELVGTVLRPSKFFQDYYNWDKTVTTELRFPNNVFIRPFSGEDSSALGMAIFSSIVNEMSFMKIVTKSKKAGNSANTEYNQAARIYRTLSRRIKGRFNKYGKVPGKMVLISSAKEEGDFIHKRLQELEAISVEERAKVYVMKMSQWDSFEGLDRLSSETFLVEKGDETKQSRIIKSRDEALEASDIIEVPMDYYGEFEKDIDGALADIAGEFIAGGTKKFIPYKEDILKAAQIHTELSGGEQLFIKDSIIFDKVIDPYNPDYTKVVNMDYINTLLTPNAEHALHIDYGFTGDPTGIAISHVSSFKLIQSAKVYDVINNGYKEITNTSLPVFFVDGVLQVYASSGSEVDIDFVEGLVYFLKEHINIKWATFDSYESRGSIQGFKKRGIISGMVSTVSNLEPYTELKNAIKTQRIIYPNSSVLLREIRDLERTPQGKIDHPITSGGGPGTKDVADSVAATLHILMRKTSAIRGRTNVTEAERQNIQKRELPTVQRRSRFSRV